MKRRRENGGKKGKKGEAVANLPQGRKTRAPRQSCAPAHKGAAHFTPRRGLVAYPRQAGVQLYD